jgi:hypothetical protein
MKNKHSLDNQQLCFLSVFFNTQNEIESISFDVEAADDYHYQIYADQFPKLCEYLQCQNNEDDIVSAFARQLKTWSNPIEIAELCRKADVKFQVHRWY